MEGTEQEQVLLQFLQREQQLHELLGMICSVVMVPQQVKVPAGAAARPIPFSKQGLLEVVPVQCGTMPTKLHGCGGSNAAGGEDPEVQLRILGPPGEGVVPLPIPVCFALLSPQNESLPFGLAPEALQLGAEDFPSAKPLEPVPPFGGGNFTRPEVGTMAGRR